MVRTGTPRSDRWLQDLRLMPVFVSGVFLSKGDVSSFPCYIRRRSLTPASNNAQSTVTQLA